MLALPAWDVISFSRHQVAVLPVFVTPINRLVKRNALSLLASITGVLDFNIVSVISVIQLVFGHLVEVAEEDPVE